MFVPLIALVPVTASVGVEEPDSVTALTVVGVIAPSVRLIAGVVVLVATVPETPFAVVTETLVTVPEPPPDAVIVMDPGAFAIVTPLPAVRVAFAKSPFEPMSN